MPPGRIAEAARELRRAVVLEPEQRHPIASLVQASRERRADSTRGARDDDPEPAELAARAQGDSSTVTTVSFVACVHVIVPCSNTLFFPPGISVSPLVG